MKLWFAVVLALTLAACDGQAPPTVQGWAEGDFLALGPVDGGRLASRPVARGDRVAKGAVLFQMDATALTAARDAARQAMAEAQANLTDLTKGARPEEVAVTDAQITEAKSAVRLATVSLARTRSLAAGRNASRQALDQAEAEAAQAAARLARLKAERQVQAMGARADRIASAEAARAAAAARLDEAQWHLDRATMRAPADGVIDETFHQPGETIGAAVPVLSLLPDDGIKIRFFVPEAARATLALGSQVALACDGCPAGLTATVRFVASREEFTPPPVYTLPNRASFVFLVEARQDGTALRLRPGQPLDVTLPTPP